MTTEKSEVDKLGTGKPGTEESETSETGQVGKSEKQRKEIIAHCLTSLLWTAALTLVFTLLLDEAFPAQGEQLKAAAYTCLSNSLAQGEHREDIPVSVIDISSLIPKRINRPGGVIFVTPREDMQAFLTAIIMNPETRPRVVGIDVDFSPDSIGLNDPNDLQFFNFCSRMGLLYHTPIYLGVKRAIAAGPDGWLGLPQYRSMAASIGMPREDTKYLPARIGLSGALDGETLPSMGAALGKEYAGDPPERLHGFVRVFQDDPTVESNSRLRDKVNATQFLADYSLVKALQNRARPIKDFAPPLSGREKEMLFDKIVLLGNDDPSRQDMQILPNGKMVPGVYFHACAAATLAGSPLYEFGFWQSLGLDFLLAFVLIGGYTLIRLWLHRQDKTLNVELKVLFVLLSAFVVWSAVRLAQGGMIPGIHIMWLDFILVAVAYLMHTPIEHFLSEQAAKLAKKSDEVPKA